MLSETSVLPPVFVFLNLVMYIINIDIKERFEIRNHGMDRFYLKYSKFYLKGCIIFSMVVSS